MVVEDVTKSVLRVRLEALVPSRRLPPSPRHGRRVRLHLAVAEGVLEVAAAVGKVNLV